MCMELKTCFDVSPLTIILLFPLFSSICFVAAVCVPVSITSSSLPHHHVVLLHVVCVYLLFTPFCSSNLICCESLWSKCQFVCFLFVWFFWMSCFVVSFTLQCLCWTSIIQTWVWLFPLPPFGTMLYPPCALFVCMCVSHSESVWILSQTVLWCPQKFKPPDWISQI